MHQKGKYVLAVASLMVVGLLVAPTAKTQEKVIGPQRVTFFFGANGLADPKGGVLHYLDNTQIRCQLDKKDPYAGSVSKFVELSNITRIQLPDGPNLNYNASLKYFEDLRVVRIFGPINATFKNKNDKSIQGVLRYLDQDSIQYTLDGVLQKPSHPAHSGIVRIQLADGRNVNYNSDLKRFEDERLQKQKKQVHDEARKIEAAMAEEENRKREAEELPIRKLAKELREGKHVIRISNPSVSQQSTFDRQTKTITWDLGRGLSMSIDDSFDLERLSDRVYVHFAVENPTDFPMEVTIRLKATFQDGTGVLFGQKYLDHAASAVDMIGPRSIGFVIVPVNCNRPIIGASNTPIGLSRVAKIANTAVTDVKTSVR